MAEFRISMKLCLHCNQYFQDANITCPIAGIGLEPVGGEPLIGTILTGNYLVNSVIGKGPAGIVYQAEYLPESKKVAIKVLHSCYGTEKPIIDRFLRENSRLIQLRHRHIAEVIELGVTNDQQPFFSEEYVSGTSLAELIKKRGPQTITSILSILEQISDALVEAHKQSIIHQRLKPANIFLTNVAPFMRLVKVTDFGVADALKTMIGRNQTVEPGNAPYMSPEQWRNDVLDGRSDIYSLAVIVFELLTADLPFPQSDPNLLRKMHLNEAPRRLSQVSTGLIFPSALEAIISKAMDKKPDGRYSSIKEFWLALKSASLSATDNAPMDAGEKGVTPDLFSLSGNDRLITIASTNNDLALDSEDWMERELKTAELQLAKMTAMESSAKAAAFASNTALSSVDPPNTVSNVTMDKTMKNESEELSKERPETQELSAWAKLVLQKSKAKQQEVKPEVATSPHRFEDAIANPVKPTNPFALEIDKVLDAAIINNTKQTSHENATNKSGAEPGIMAPKEQDNTASPTGLFGKISSLSKNSDALAHHDWKKAESSPTTQPSFPTELSPPAPPPPPAQPPPPQQSLPPVAEDLMVDQNKIPTIEALEIHNEHSAASAEAPGVQAAAGETEKPSEKLDRFANTLGDSLGPAADKAIESPSPELFSHIELDSIAASISQESESQSAASPGKPKQTASKSKISLQNVQEKSDGLITRIKSLFGKKNHLEAMPSHLSTTEIAQAVVAPAADESSPQTISSALDEMKTAPVAGANETPPLAVPQSINEMPVVAAAQPSESQAQMIDRMPSAQNNAVSDRKSTIPAQQDAGGESSNNTVVSSHAEQSVDVGRLAPGPAPLIANVAAEPVADFQARLQERLKSVAAESGGVKQMPKAEAKSAISEANQEATRSSAPAIFENRQDPGSSARQQTSGNEAQDPVARLLAAATAKSSSAADNAKQLMTDAVTQDALDKKMESVKKKLDALKREAPPAQQFINLPQAPASSPGGYLNAQMAAPANQAVAPSPSALEDTVQFTLPSTAAASAVNEQEMSADHYATEDKPAATRAQELINQVMWKKEAASISQDRYPSALDLERQINQNRARMGRENRAKMKGSLTKNHLPFSGILSVIIVTALGIGGYFAFQNFGMHRAPVPTIDNLIETRQYSEALNILDKLQKSGQSTGKDAERYIKIAKRYADSGNYPDAIAVLAKVPHRSTVYRQAQKLTKKFREYSRAKKGMRH